MRIISLFFNKSEDPNAEQCPFLIDEENILKLAAGGFESTVRLAKSNAETWAPIFLQNSEYIIEVLDSYLEKMNLFKQFIREKNSAGLIELMNEANKIRKILN